MNYNHSRSPLYQKVLNLSLIIVFFIFGGAIAFIISEDINFLDAIWLSLMTVTTVGFGVPENFSNWGKIISIFLMLFGVGTVLYALSVLTLEILNGNILKEYKQKKIDSKMQKLENHIIICGFGRNGRQAGRKLQLHNKPFVFIERKDIEIRKDEFQNTIFIKGNASEDATLLKAGIERASGVISALPSDADNLFVVISARGLNKKLNIISRASDSNSISKLKIAGANNVIMPDKIGGEHMASLLVTPDLVEFMDNIALEGTKSINLIEINTNDLDDDFIGREIKDLYIRKNTGCSIIGHKDKEGKYTINPDNSMKIEKNSYIIVLGRPEQITKLKEGLLFL